MFASSPGSTGIQISIRCQLAAEDPTGRSTVRNAGDRSSCCDVIGYP